MVANYVSMEEMSKENAMQINIFTGELFDTRTRVQKKRAAASQQPRQAEMFSQRELAQFGVKANPKLPISPKTRIELAMEDPRTAEEKARDLQQEIEENTVPMPWSDDADMNMNEPE